MRIVVLLSFLVVAVCGQTSLRAVLEYCRHGSRHPIVAVPMFKHPWNPDYAGLLTPVGMRQHYLLGKQLRKRYVDTGFLNATYNPQEVRVSADRDARVWDSAQCQLTGIFDLGSGPSLTTKQQQIHVPFNVQNRAEIEAELGSAALGQSQTLIPIHRTQADKNVIAPPRMCPKIPQIEDWFDTSTEFDNFYKQHFDGWLKTQLEDIFHVKITRDQVWPIQDWFDVNSAMGYDLPSDVTPDIREALDKIVKFGFFEESHYNKYALQLWTSDYYRQLMDYFDGVINGSSPRKFQLFSGHDSGVVPLVKSIELIPYNVSWVKPAYASNVIHELHYIDNDYYVQSYYNLEKVWPKRCGTPCKYTDFKKLCQEMYLPNWEEECHTAFVAPKTFLK